jgi:hypothetical protein
LLSYISAPSVILNVSTIGVLQVWNRNENLSAAPPVGDWSVHPVIGEVVSPHTAGGVGLDMPENISNQMFFRCC